MLRQAIAAHQSGKFADAERLYRRALEVNSKHFFALVMFGLLKGQLGEYREAERLLGDAVRFNPSDAGAQFNYGNVLIALQRFDEAFTAFGKAWPSIHPLLTRTSIVAASMSQAVQGSDWMFRRGNSHRQELCGGLL